MIGLRCAALQPRSSLFDNCLVTLKRALSISIYGLVGAGPIAALLIAHFAADVTVRGPWWSGVLKWAVVLLVSTLFFYFIRIDPGTRALHWRGRRDRQLAEDATWLSEVHRSLCWAADASSERSRVVLTGGTARITSIT